MVDSDAQVFVDTGFFKALVDEKDEHFQEAKRILAQLRKQETILVTTNFVLVESWTLIRVRSGMFVVKKFRESLANSLKDVKVIRVALEDEESAWKWFIYDWEGLSFIDCVSFAVMKRLGIRKVAAFDEHFEMAGFEVVKG